jgi:hypothetical protein
MCVVMLAFSPSLTCSVAFGENLVITAYVSKTGGDWWYGTIASNGKAGFFPKTYVQTFETGESFYHELFFLLTFSQSVQKDCMTTQGEVPTSCPSPKAI